MKQEEPGQNLSGEIPLPKNIRAPISSLQKRLIHGRGALERQVVLLAFVPIANG